ncbi:MAG: kynureninase [Mycobacteriales bacterium]
MDAATATDADPGTAAPTRAAADRLDAADPLRGLRSEFAVPDEAVVYLDGNSLGRPPRVALAALRTVAEEEWAGGLIGSWEQWMDLPQRVGDLIGKAFLGARPGEVLVTDTTTVNLYRLLLAALDARPGRRVIVTDVGNFPTDRYLVEGLAHQRGLTVRRVPTHLDGGPDLTALAEAIDGDTAVVTLSHVGYRSGAVLDLDRVTELVHAAGALVVWDLSHSAGAVPVDLTRAGADLAAGCTYKHLCGGPGAPAYLYVRQELQEQLRSPIWGWFGSSDLFRMAPHYEPAAGVRRFLGGSPPVLALRCLEAAVGLLAETGIDALHAKATALGEFALLCAQRWLIPLGVAVASPQEPESRGAQLTLHHPRAAQLVAELAASGVIADYREPERIRLGLAAATTRFTDVWDGLDRLRQLLAG